MTNRFSEPGAGTHISATVKLYDPAKGYGFLVPGDGSPDIFCGKAALAAVGLDTLLAGATVACETVPGRRGPEVSRIRAVDFSTASPRTASIARPRDDERTAAGPDAGQPGAAASGRAVRAIVKWFHPDKGYGFLEPGDGSADLFCHLTAVQASGIDTLPQGAAVTCEIAPGDRGPQVSRILSVDPPASGSARTGLRSGGPAIRNRSFEARHPGPLVYDPPRADMEAPGSVKFYDPARGFGFVVPDDGGPEVFVHCSVLFRSGMTDLLPGQRVFVRAESVPRGLQAREIEPL